MSRRPSIRLTAALAVAVVAFAGVACSGDGEPAAGPTTASPSPTPTERDVEPVDGTAHVDVVDTSSGPVLRGGSGQEPEQEAVDAFVEQVVSWLDGHLGGLQSGGSGDLETVAADGLLDGTDPAALTAVTTRLATPERPVEAAEYHIQIGHAGAPQWLRVDVRVSGRDGLTRQAHFTFEATDSGPVLIAAGPSRDDPVEDEQQDDDEEDS